MYFKHCSKDLHVHVLTNLYLVAGEDKHQGCSSSSETPGEESP